MLRGPAARAAAYWKAHIPDHLYFNPECESLVVLILNTRRRIKGHYLVSIGTMDIDHTNFAHDVRGGVAMQVVRIRSKKNALALITAFSPGASAPLPFLFLCRDFRYHLRHRHIKSATNARSDLYG